MAIYSEAVEVKVPTNTELFLSIFNLSRQNYFLDRFFIFGANELIFVMTFFAFALILSGKVKERKAFLLLGWGFIIAEVLIKLTHFFYVEPRPYVTLNLIPLINHIPDASFPSEHTTITSLMAFAYIFSKSKQALLFSVLAIWVGFSRIFVGVHYPLDVLGGMLYGLISISLSFSFNKIVFKI